MRARTGADAGKSPRRASRSTAGTHSRKVSPKPPASAHRSIPKKLTSVPENPHRALPNVLTNASRKRSPPLSRKGSPGLPARAHRQLPRRLTGCSRIGSPYRSRKSSLAAPEKSHLCSVSDSADGQCARCAPEHGAGTGDMRRTTRMPSTATNAASRGTHSFQQVAKRASYRSAYRRAKSRTICIPNYNRCVRSRPCITDIAHSAATAHDTVGGSSTLVVAITVAASS